MPPNPPPAQTSTDEDRATARRGRWRFMLLLGFTLGYVISDLWEKLT